MANAEKIWQRVQSLTFYASQDITADILRVQDIDSLMIVVNGTLAIGTAAATALADGGAANILSTLEFVANGKDVLDQRFGKIVSLGNYYRKFRPMNTDPGLAVGDQALTAVYILDRDNILGPRPKDSALQAYLTNLLQLRIRTGALSDVVVPAGTTTLAFTGTIDIYTDSTNELLPASRGEPKAVKKVTYQQQIPAGANANLQFRLPVGNVIRSVGLYTEDNTGASSDAIVSDLSFAVDGIDVRYSGNYATAKLKNARDLDIPLTDVPTGFAMLDLAPSGKVSEMIDLSIATECILTCNVLKAGTIYVEVTEFILPPPPPPGSAAAKKAGG